LGAEEIRLIFSLIRKKKKGKKISHRYTINEVKKGGEEEIFSVNVSRGTRPYSP